MKMIKSRKAVSEMVSYTLLVVIAVGLSIFVYNYLSVYTPKDHATCTDDIHIILQSYGCDTGSSAQLNLSLLNKGIFSIDAAYIRFGPAERKVKDLINSNDLYFTEFIGDGTPGLIPGESVTKTFQLPITAGTKYGIEIQPAVFSKDNELALCSQAVIVQEITCPHTNTISQQSTQQGTTTVGTSGSGSDTGSGSTAGGTTTLPTCTSNNCNVWGQCSEGMKTCTAFDGTCNPSQTITSTSGCQQVITLTYSSTTETQTYLVPAGRSSITVKAWGAGGLNAEAASEGNDGFGGGGGFVKGTFSVQPNDEIFITVGAPTQITSVQFKRGTTTYAQAIPGGGGSAGSSIEYQDEEGYDCAGENGGAGGGSTGVNGDIDEIGGKGGTQTAGGAGGVAIGAYRGATAGGAGTQFIGGAPGSGADSSGGKGGAGWYGGGGGGGAKTSSADTCGGGGGGGSGFVDYVNALGNPNSLLAPTNVQNTAGEGRYVANRNTADGWVANKGKSGNPGYVILQVV